MKLVLPGPDARADFRGIPCDSQLPVVLDSRHSKTSAYSIYTTKGKGLSMFPGVGTALDHNSRGTIV